VANTLSDTVLSCHHRPGAPGSGVIRPEGLGDSAYRTEKSVRITRVSPIASGLSIDLSLTFTRTDVSSVCQDADRVEGQGLVV